MTRARDNNEICAVTESDDVAEARDVLEGIVAPDRADIPGHPTSYPRSAATGTRTSSAACLVQTPRCVIPDWFEPLAATMRR